MIRSAALSFLLATTLPAAAAEDAPSAKLGELTHIHGVVIPAGSDEVLLATHFGLFAAGNDGTARMISEAADDFMGFTGARDGRLYASGHPANGGNLGVIGAATPSSAWADLGTGDGGLVDFHAMTVSPVNPDTIYGSYGGIQVSRDGGYTWTTSGMGPSELIDLAAAADNPDHLFAGTMAGLMESRDAGQTWTPVAYPDVPVTAVEVAPDGALHVFAAGIGLSRLDQSGGFSRISPMTDQVILHMAFDPDAPKTVIAVTTESRVLSSNDEGQSWLPFVR